VPSRRKNYESRESARIGANQGGAIPTPNPQLESNGTTHGSEANIKKARGPVEFLKLLLETACAIPEHIQAEHHH